MGSKLPQVRPVACADWHSGVCPCPCALPPPRPAQPAPAHQPHHEVGEHGNPQRGRDEGDHEELLPAGLAAVGDGDAQEEDEGPCEHPLGLVPSGLCGEGAERDTHTHWVTHLLDYPSLYFSN